MTEVPPSTTKERPLPERIGGYSVVKRLSRGGMGEVLLGVKAAPGGFEKRVAIKVVLPGFDERDEYRTLFFDEASLAARMSHPNLCQVFDFGEDNGILYLVMEYVDGISVEAVLEKFERTQTFLPFPIAASIISQAARGLHSAHTLLNDDGQTLGVVHRDVSPQNLIVTKDGACKVLDFGIARSRVRQSQTQIGVVRGKPGYMAPEQAYGDDLDPRTDIFQLGTVLFEMLTSKALFRRETVYASIRAAVEDAPPPISSFRSDVPAELEQVLLRAIAKERRDRFPDAEAFATAIDRVLVDVGAVSTASELASFVKKNLGATSSSVVAAGRSANENTAVVGAESPRPPDAQRMTSVLSSHKGAEENALAVGPTTSVRTQRRADAANTGAKLVTADAFNDAEGSQLSRVSTKSPTRIARFVLAGFVVVVVLFALFFSDNEELPMTSSGAAFPAVTSTTPAALVANSTTVPTQEFKPDPPPETTVVVAPPPSKPERPKPSPRPSRQTGSKPTVVEATPVLNNDVAVPQPSTFGFVDVRASVWGTLEIDGARVGVTPSTHRLTVGSHHVVLRDAATGTVRAEKSVDVQEGSTTVVKFRE